MIKNFAELELDENLLVAIEEMGYTRPTQIQAEAIPQALDGRDILASAPTGTGKTAAFVLPALQYLQDFPRRKPGPARVLILTPTRELAMQVADQARALAKNTNLNIFTITGGVQYQEHADILAKTQDIVVATPGRLMEYIEAERFDCRAIEWLILDEADRMLDMGFGRQLIAFLLNVAGVNKRCSSLQLWKAKAWKDLPQICLKNLLRSTLNHLAESVKRLPSGITVPMIWRIN